MKLESFAIEHPTGKTTFVDARYFKINKLGCLAFYVWPWKVEAAFQPGAWVRVMRGLTQAELQDGEL